jgi:hypothetical protein
MLQHIQGRNIASDVRERSEANISLRRLLSAAQNIHDCASQDWKRVEMCWVLFRSVNEWNGMGL